MCADSAHQNRTGKKYAYNDEYEILLFDLHSHLMMIVQYLQR